MKLLKTLSLVAAIGAALIPSIHAATVQTDVWSAAGGAWTLANQPSYVAHNGGTLNPDAASDSGAKLTVGAFTVAAPPTFTSYGMGLYNDYLYTFFSTPALSISSSNLLDNVGTLSFNLVSSAAFSNLSITLNYDGAVGLDSFASIVIGHDEGFNVDIVSYIWTWDVSGLPSASSLSLGWTTPTAHSVYYSAALTQTQAVPEPSSLVLIAIGSAALYFKRRRSAN